MGEYCSEGKRKDLVGDVRHATTTCTDSAWFSFFMSPFILEGGEGSLSLVVLSGISAEANHANIHLHHILNRPLHSPNLSLYSPFPSHPR